ncbi:DNA mismatch repair protein MutS [Haliangium ochraceum]|nr:DNA mismatch repair protein MutS [Haliangium ochraceum]
MMRQYMEIKDQHPDAVLFFRLGDFYEMFYEDAEVAAKALDLTLTCRHKDSANPVPMAGVPHHAARGYIARLTEQGYKVVVCEQVEDPKLVKGIVKRAVAQVITPGVVLDEEVLDPKQPRYLAAIACEGGRYGLSFLDVSTGEFRATELDSEDGLLDELARVRPREILAGARNLAEGGPLTATQRDFNQVTYSPVEPHTWGQAKTLLVSLLAGDSASLGLEERILASRAAADVIGYARSTQPTGVLPVSRLQLYEPGDTMMLDEAAIANLELTETLIGGRRAGTLLSVIDETCTAPGGRLLRHWLLYPLSEVAPIRRRQDAVGYFVEHASLRRSVREVLEGVHDLERLAARVGLGVATPRDLGRLRDSLVQLPSLSALLASPVVQAGGESPLDAVPALLRFNNAILGELAELQGLLSRALVDEPGPLAREGGFIRAGYCRIVDESRSLADGSKEAILAIETRERERTGIGSLKVKYNRVFGYYIEVTKANLARVPAEYVRKQTIATGERYVTTELAELETKVLGAQERLLEREQELFAELCAAVGERAGGLRDVGERVAGIDCLANLAEIAHVRDYRCPEVDDGERLEIVEGRHPVVERTVPTGRFVPNDCQLDPREAQILLITGPNMAGKSTYMRQVAQIVVLAQMGSFVPAKRARVGIVDRVYTRVGAADNLARGESTFMVEMRETSAIMRGATRRSLVVLDEVGRGTSTFDGVSIAWAVTEYLHDAIGARTLFATHYHELCALSEVRPRVRNVSMAIREHEGDIVFLRQVVAGGASKSYGIEVARLAGLPRSLVSRARQILAQLEGGREWHQPSQLTLFSAAQSAPPDEPEGEAGGAIVERLRGLDPQRMTPIEALQVLAELCSEAGR